MKRLFDFSVAVTLSVLFLPIFILVALFVKHKLGSPVLFRQIRPGLNGKPFTLYKFRSMTDLKDETGKLLPDEKRFNRFSYLLRTSSLDELPELINVIKGDMSLVGPRPLLMRYLKRYNNQQARRHDVRPGITGWAQINGRNSLNWQNKFNLDIWYIENQSFGLDLKILFLTIFQVVKCKNVNQDGYATAGEFMGNSDV